MYVSVVSREIVSIDLTLHALNDLEVKISDIQNAYLTAPCSKKIWTKLSSEFGPDLSGKKSLVVVYLYGLNYVCFIKKSSGRVHEKYWIFFVPGRSIFMV